jgi:hypothetical protein
MSSPSRSSNLHQVPRFISVLSARLRPSRGSNVIDMMTKGEVWEISYVRKGALSVVRLSRIGQQHARTAERPPVATMTSPLMSDGSFRSQHFVAEHSDDDFARYCQY